MRPRLVSTFARRIRRLKTPPPKRRDRRRILPPSPSPYRLQDSSLATIDTKDLASAWQTPLDEGPQSVMQEVHPDVWAGPVFSSDWCERLLQEVQNYQRWSIRHATPWATPNTMHHRGILMKDLGLEGLFDQWMRDRLQPVVESLFSGHVWGELVECHAYVVEYSRESQAHLGFHVDDSQVTLNLCLGEQFEGSDLYFEGPRCAMHVDTSSQGHEGFTWAHQPGVAVLHAGKNRHGVHPIQTGRRWSLILWFRDASGRHRWERDWEQEHCPDWCGYRDPSDA